LPNEQGGGPIKLRPPDKGGSVYETLHSSPHFVQADVLATAIVLASGIALARAMTFPNREDRSCVDTANIEGCLEPVVQVVILHLILESLAKVAGRVGGDQENSKARRASFCFRARGGQPCSHRI